MFDTRAEAFDIVYIRTVDGVPNYMAARRPRLLYQTAWAGALHGGGPGEASALTKEGFPYSGSLPEAEESIGGRACELEE